MSGWSNKLNINLVSDVSMQPFTSKMSVETKIIIPYGGEQQLFSNNKEHFFAIDSKVDASISTVLKMLYGIDM